MLKDGERINEINEKLKLIEKKDSLTFGTDAYLLSAFLPRKKNGVAVELGTGSGVISLLALSKEKCRHVYGIEVQKEIFDVAERNAELNSLEDKFTLINKDLRNVTVADIGKEADIVFSNPPYMTQNSGKSNSNSLKNISRHEVCGGINDFCKCAKKLLKHGGSFYVVYRPDRLSDLIFALKSNSLEPKKLTFIHTNTDTPPSILLIEAKLGGKSGLNVEKPIYVYEKGTLQYTKQFENIYKYGDMEEHRE
jgi:tRNA1Val (adenine37-N6)-methyltransferase